MRTTYPNGLTKIRVQKTDSFLWLVLVPVPWYMDMDKAPGLSDTYWPSYDEAISFVRALLS